MHDEAPLPEFHADWLRPPPAPPPGHYIAAVMLFPGDEKAREAYLAAEFAADAARYARVSGKAIEGKIAHWLYDAPRQRDVINDRRAKSINASSNFVAWALCYVLQAVADGRPEIASITRATDVAAAKPGARAWGTLDKAWKAYSGVAHLWLAFHAGVALGFSPWGDRHGDREVLLYWLAFAEDLRRQGEAWKPEHAEKPVLDTMKTWRVPADFDLPVPYAHIDLDRLAGRGRRRLARRVHRGVIAAAASGRDGRSGSQCAGRWRCHPDRLT